MKLKLLNTTAGLKPLYDEDYDEKKKLKLGEIYEVTIKQPRNLAFHRKYFALINLAWEYQPEKVVEHFHHNQELFRKTVEVAAGWCDVMYSINRKEWVEIPKSIAFDKMDNDEFTLLYDRVKDILYAYFLKDVSTEEFEKHLIQF